MTSITTLEQNVYFFRKMCRLLEMKRSLFLTDYWQNNVNMITFAQFEHLTKIQHILPCNLSKLMLVSGLTSAGASLFVTKLVDVGLLNRIDNPQDRRNILISTTEQGQQLIAGVEAGLDEFVKSYFQSLENDVLSEIGSVSKIICEQLKGDDPEEI